MACKAKRSLQAEEGADYEGLKYVQFDKKGKVIISKILIYKYEMNFMLTNLRLKFSILAKL